MASMPVVSWRASLAPFLDYVLLHAASLCGLTALLYAPGVLFERLLLRGPALPSYRHLTRFVLGILVWLTVIFLLAAVGLLRPAVLRAVAIGAIVAALAVTRRSAPPSPVADADRRTPWNWGSAIPFVVTAIVFVALFIEGLRPPPAWDASTYHLTIPRLYLEHGGFRPIPFNVYSNWPLNTELLFALAMGLHDYLLATLVQLLFAGLTAATLLRVCRLHGHPHAGPVAVCLFLANDVVLFEAGVAYVDLALAFFFVMALACLLEADREPVRRRPALILAGVCCGLMAGVKLIGLFGVVCIALLHVWRSWRRQALRTGMMETVCFVAAPCVVLALPWYAKAAWYTGNPLYPFFFEALRGNEWNHSLGEQFQAWQRSLGMGRTLRDYMLLPTRLILEGGSGYHRFDGRVAAAWVALVPLILAGAWRSVVVRRAGAAGLVYFVCWAFSSQQARFLLPAIAVLSIAAAVTLDVFARAWRPPALRTTFVVLLSAGAGVHLFASATGTFADARRWLDRYLADSRAALDAAVPPVFQYVNRELPANARLLFLNTNTGFFCRREYMADSFFEASQVNTFLLRNRRSAEIQSTLLARGLTHILVGHDRWGIPYPPTLDEFLAERTRLVYTSPQGDLLHEILPR